VVDDDNNDGGGLGYHSKYRFYSGDVEVTPWKPLSLRFQYGQIRNDTRIPIIVPTNFTTTDSVYAEKGMSYEVGLGLNLDVVQLSAMGSKFENQGSFAFKIDRARVRAEVPVVPTFSLVGEWNYDKYYEAIYTYGDYKAHRYGPTSAGTRTDIARLPFPRPRIPRGLFLSGGGAGGRASAKIAG